MNQPWSELADADAYAAPDEHGDARQVAVELRTAGRDEPFRVLMSGAQAAHLAEGLQRAAREVAQGTDEGDASQV